jgi:glycosyltransferase involved in cell wall biosynthesis
MVDNDLCDRMIFYYPFSIPAEAISGSRLRLSRMLQAFRDIGYQVEVVAGLAKDRHRTIQHVKKLVEKGRRFDFLYAESSTLPSLLAKGNFYRPLLDFNFFRWLRRQDIPTGLFYRDVYWRFSERKNIKFPKRCVAIPMYWYDWWLYRLFVDYLFLPSLAMRSALPSSWPSDRSAALPAGSDIVASKWDKKSQKSTLYLFYVGGVKPPLYDLKAMFEVVESLDGVHLTVCCRDFEWLEVQSYYRPFNQAKIHIVHASGKALKNYYDKADIFGLFRRSNAYLDFAMPVKLFEALGHAVPIVTTAGTEVARFVIQEDIGWVIETKAELRLLLARLRDNRDLIASKRARMLEIREQHTWQARAQKVADILKRYHV